MYPLTLGLPDNANALFVFLDLTMCCVCASLIIVTITAPPQLTAGTTVFTATAGNSIAAAGRQPAPGLGSAGGSAREEESGFQGDAGDTGAPQGQALHTGERRTASTCHSSCAMMHAFSNLGRVLLGSLGSLIPIYSTLFKEQVR